MIGLLVVGYVVAVFIGTVWCCRVLATRARYERLWREIEARRLGARLTPAMRVSVRAAQERLKVAR